tara:strand:+ start:5387 stop:6310 length:924 start_codon:yes stop_codon:yes gene_type:complete
MKRNLFDLSKGEKNRVRRLHESYSNSHGTLLLREATTDEVTTFQETWNDRNPDDQITVDGKAGSKTRERVKKFQEAAKIKADGIIGPQTLTKMDELDDTWWDKFKKFASKTYDEVKDAFSGDDSDGEVLGDEEIDPDEEGMCPNAKNDKAYRMIKKAVAGWGTDEKMLFKGLKMITSWDEYKNMSEVVRCEYPDEYKSVSAMIMSDLSGRDLDKFKAARRAIKQSGNMEGVGDSLMTTWDKIKKRQAERLGGWVTLALEQGKREAEIKATAIKKAREWGWKAAQWSPFWMLARKEGKQKSWFEDLFS